MNAGQIKKFLSERDMVWTSLPERWDEGPFLGNGCTGALFYVENGRPVIKPGRNDIYDNRPIEWYSVMDKQFAQPRLQLGPVEIITLGKPTGCRLRLSLYDAVLSGEIFTDKGSVEISIFIPKDKEAIVVTLSPSENEKAELRYVPVPAESPRQTKMVSENDPRMRKDYAPPRDAYPTVRKYGALIYEQPLFSGGSYCLALKKKADNYVVAVSVSDDDGKAVPEALETIDCISDVKSVFDGHCGKWHKIYEKSFFSVADPVWDNFYWIQLYKTACLARPGGRIVDTMGPWAMTTSWPSAFWNLNVQLTYAPMIPTGMFEAARSLPDCLSAERNNLNLNIAPEYREGCYGIGTNTCRSLRSEVAVPGKTKEKHFKIETGNLTWALQVCYTLYRTTLDEKMLTETILPLLEGTVNYYRHFLFEDENGVLHLMPTESPEYLVVDEDTNYDLALLNWGLGILIKENRRLETDSEKVLCWEDIRSRLTPYPEDEDEGLMIAGHTHLTCSHRHYSHLLAFYPLHLLDANSEVDAEKIKKSVAHWHSMPEMLEGYSMTGAASMCAMLHDGDKGIEYLDRLMRDYIRPSTLYLENGGPVTETPLAAVSSLTDMMLQSYGDVIRVFPACPERWRDASFTLFAEGGIKVSADRRDGRLQFVKLVSRISQEIRLYAGFDTAPEVSTAFEYQDGLYTVFAAANEEIILKSSDARTTEVSSAVRGENIFGKNGKTFSAVSEVPYCERGKR